MSKPSTTQTSSTTATSSTAATTTTTTTKPAAAAEPKAKPKREYSGGMAFMLHPSNGRSGFAFSDPSAPHGKALVTVTDALVNAMAERERELLEHESGDVAVEVRKRVALEFGFEGEEGGRLFKKPLLS